MLDRLAAGLITLPSEAYDLVLLLSEPQLEGGEGEERARQLFVEKDVMLKLVRSMRAGARIQRQNGRFGAVAAERTEALLAGLLDDDGGAGAGAVAGGMVKPTCSDTSAVPLRFGKRRKEEGKGETKIDIDGDGGGGSRSSTNGSVPAVTNANGKRGVASSVLAGTENGTVNGVGFVDFSDDLEAEIMTGEDDELVDEDSLLTEADLARPVIQRRSFRFIDIFWTATVWFVIV